MDCQGVFLCYSIGMRDKAPKLAMLMKRLLEAIKGVVQAIQKNTESIHAAEERERQKKPAGEATHRIIAFDDKTVRDAKEENDRQYRTQTSIKTATWLAVIAACIYATIAAWQGWEMRKAAMATQDAAVAAQKAADTAANQLELAERPWVDANISLDGPFTFNINGASIPLKITLRNTGHSPALTVTISPLPLIGHKAANAANYREQVCQDAIRIATTMPQFGVALFPNVNFEQREEIGIGKEEIESGKASKEFPDSHFGDVILSPSVVICIAYRPTFNQTSVYHTAYIVDLLKLDSANRLGVAFKIGEDVDQKHLLLRLGSVGAITAN
jgi:hypothetical protein